MTPTSAAYSDSSVRLEMPTTTGDPGIGRWACYGEVFATSVSFVTEPEALASLLPPAMTPQTTPLVTLSMREVRQAERLAGKPYNIVAMYLAAAYDTGEELLEANYAVNFWENDANSIMAGREYFGVPKLYADIPDVVRDGKNWSFECSEYGSSLITGTFSGMAEGAPTPEPSDVSSFYFGWKWIPGMLDEPDVDYVSTIDSVASIARTWHGEGQFEFHTPDYASAPASSRVMAKLAELPVLSWRPAVATLGSSQIDRSASRRLSSTQPKTGLLS